MSDRTILHCDMNNFYASVECMLNPELRDKCVAVCGSEETRHGIVLAKNENAKAFGVKTGEAVWEANQKCPELTVVPPHYDEYIRFSRLAQEIYYRYTDLIEPYGPDECWLDVTGSRLLFGNGKEIADRIRSDIYAELGLTVSVGVSFNKIFAKLGSDLKKPDATTVISHNNFKEEIFHLPARALLGVGNSTAKKLSRYGINTIGQLADSSEDFLHRILGKNGLLLHNYANGLEHSPVSPYETQVPLKSIGHGITAVRDLENEDEVWRVFLELTQEIGHRLRECHSLCSKVSISVRMGDLKRFNRQCSVTPTHSPMIIAKTARKLFHDNYRWEIPVRSLSVTAEALLPESTPIQHDLFCDIAYLQKLNRIEDTVDALRGRFGNDAVRNAVLCTDIALPPHKKVLMPSGMI